MHLQKHLNAIQCLEIFFLVLMPFYNQIIREKNQIVENVFQIVEVLSKLI